MKSPVIYRIRNVVNQKFYVGSTGDTRERFRCHRNRLRKGKHHSQHLQAAWNKYGEECFVFEVVEVVSDMAALCQAEDIWLNKYVGQECCYNKSKYSTAPMRGIAKEDHPNYRKEVSADTREQISKSLKEYYAESPENHPRYGKKHTPETLEKIKATRIAPKGEDHYRYGATLSAEARKKIGDTQRGVAKGVRVYTTEGLKKAQETMKRIAKEHPQERKGFSEVLQKFPKDVLDKYDFSNAVYTGALNRITGCICPTHGEFSQYAAQLRKGRGCPSCGVVIRGEKKRVEMKAQWADPIQREKILASRSKRIS